jgi:hypothetical protein
MSIVELVIGSTEPKSTAAALTTSCGPAVDETTAAVVAAGGVELLASIVVDVVAAIDVSLDDVISGSGDGAAGSLVLTSGSVDGAGSSAAGAAGVSSSVEAAEASMRTGGVSSAGGVVAGASGSYVGALGVASAVPALGGGVAADSGSTPVGAAASVTTGTFANGSAAGSAGFFGAGTRRYVFSTTATCAGVVDCVEGRVPVTGADAGDVTRLRVAVGAVCFDGIGGTASVGNRSAGSCSSSRGTTFAFAEGIVSEANAGMTDIEMRLRKPIARIARPRTPRRSAARLGSPRTCAGIPVALMPHSPRRPSRSPLTA